MANDEQFKGRIIIAVGLLSLFGLLTFILAAATLGAVHKQSASLDSQLLYLKQKIDAIHTVVIHYSGATTVTVAPTITNTTLNATTSTSTSITTATTSTTASTSTTATTSTTTAGQR